MPTQREIDEDTQLTKLFMNLHDAVSAIRGEDDAAPGLFAQAMAMHFGTVLGVTECEGCAAIIAGICNEILAARNSPWRLVAPGIETYSRLHLH